MFGRTLRCGVVVLTAASAISVVGCDTGPAAPGAVNVAYSTRQGDEAPFTWSVSVDGASPHIVNSADSGSFVVAGVASGDHHLIVSSLPAACSAGFGNRVVSVPSVDTAKVQIAVRCIRKTGDIALGVNTVGAITSGYAVNVDGVPAGAVAAGSSSQLLLARLTPGPHEVVLTGLASNCSIALDQPHTAVVVADTAVSMTISVACKSTRALVRVSTVSTGTPLDPDGYALFVNALSGVAAANNGSLLFSVNPGAVTVVLKDIEPNCSVPSATQTVTIAPSDSASVVFNVACGPYPIGVLGATATDPVGDTLPNPTNIFGRAFDLTGLSTRYTRTFIAFTLHGNGAFATDPFLAFVDLDLDENPATGFAPYANVLGGASLAQGVDAWLQLIGPSSTALLSTVKGDLTLRMVVDADSIVVYVPYEKLSDDGNFTVSALIGPRSRPTDFVPNTAVLVSHVPAGVTTFGTASRAAESASQAASRLLRPTPVAWARVRSGRSAPPRR